MGWILKRDNEIHLPFLEIQIESYKTTVVPALFSGQQKTASLKWHPCFTVVVLGQGTLAMPGDIFGCHNWGWVVLLVFSR